MRECKKHHKYFDIYVSSLSFEACSKIRKRKVLFRFIRQRSFDDRTMNHTNEKIDDSSTVSSIRIDRNDIIK